MNTRRVGRNAAVLAAVAALATLVTVVAVWAASPSGSEERNREFSPAVVADGQGGEATVMTGEGGGGLEVTKTVETTFTRTIAWAIDKRVSPNSWYLFVGDSGTSEYTVRVTKTQVDSNWAVSGTISIHNPAQTAATITGVTDTVSPSIVAEVDCGVAFPHVLAAGGTLECTYGTALSNGSNRQNTAAVTTSGAVGGGSDTVPVVFSAPTTTVGNTSVDVVDSYAGPLGTFTGSGKAEYTRTFECEQSTNGTYTEYPNTATIVQTQQSDSAGVRVKCYDLEVRKDAETSGELKWRWQIDKSADQTSLTLEEGELFTVDYEVAVDATASGGDPSVSGDIWISNPNPRRDATLTAVSDIVSPDIAADVDCPSLTVPAGGSLHCTYSADLPDDGDRLNTATATLQNHEYDQDGIGTPSGTTDYSGTAAVTFGGATGETDECIDVSDTNVGFLGTVCADEAPKTFYYSLTFGMHPDADVVLECGENSHRNVASFVTNDTAKTGQDDWTVLAEVECGGGGCTLTPGYWKTHSVYGPAPYDDTWAQIGEDTAFFLSGQSYYQALWTEPSGGNAYYILAHAYIAAELNQLNGASIPGPVLTAFNTAGGLLGTYTPAQIGALDGGDPLRQQFIALAGTLDDYNNGLTGPGHCS